MYRGIKFRYDYSFSSLGTNFEYSSNDLLKMIYFINQIFW